MRLLPATLLLAACAQPFDAQRDTLGAFRIAALGVVDGHASAAIWSGQPLHEQPTTLEWLLDDEPVGEGWGVAVDVEQAGELALVATAADGTVLEAVVSVAVAPDPFTVARSSADLGDAWRLEDREKIDAEMLFGDVVPEGQAARLNPDVGEDLEVRWMLADGHGTLLRLTDQNTDLLREALTFDGGELVHRQDIDPGVALVLALARDGAGGNRWRWAQLPMGVGGPWATHHGLMLELGDVDVSTGLVAVTLDDLDAATGVFSFDDATPVNSSDGQDALDCADGGQPFRLDWLVGGRCAISQVQGARVVLEVE